MNIFQFSEFIESLGQRRHLGGVGAVAPPPKEKEKKKKKKEKR